jgi:hypothetical protein
LYLVRPDEFVAAEAEPADAAAVFERAMPVKPAADEAVAS